MCSHYTVVYKVYKNKIFNKKNFIFNFKTTDSTAQNKGVNAVTHKDDDDILLELRPKQLFSDDEWQPRRTQRGP